MLSLKFILLLAVLSLSAEPAPVPEMDRLIRESRLLKSEHQLARMPQIYVIFDLMEKKIRIKARGAVLKELSVEYFNLWGAPIEPKTFTLVKKTAFFKPKKTKIKPKKNDEGTIEPHTLEVGDMPVRYRLNFDGCVWLYVRSKPEGVISGLLTIFSHLKASVITRPIGTLWNALRRQTFSEIDIYLTEKDAKSLYWALPEGLRCVISAS
jgi:hypothetical protein